MTQQHARHNKPQLLRSKSVKSPMLATNELLHRYFRPQVFQGFVISAQDNSTNDLPGMIGAETAATPLDQAAIEANAGTPATPSTSCFTAAGALRDVFATPTVQDRFGTFKVAQDGIKWCMNGDPAVSANTYNIGCDGIGANAMPLAGGNPRSGWL